MIIKRLPIWLRKKIHTGTELSKTKQILSQYKLNTVCESARCPNRLECYSNKTATFLALGNQCSRSCSFCDIKHSKTLTSPDPEEPLNITAAAKKMDLKHVVITMVTRDDLSDGGAQHIANIISHLRQNLPNVSVEVLTSDFDGNLEALSIVLNQKPNVFNHNIETVERLSGKIRYRASYSRSLNILNFAKKYSNSSIKIKSGLMVGLGESEEEIKKTISDLYVNGCDTITIGQYLQASPQTIPVVEYIKPEKFKEYKQYGYNAGIENMFCGPFVRSSYHAEEHYYE